MLLTVDEQKKVIGAVLLGFPDKTPEELVDFTRIAVEKCNEMKRVFKVAEGSVLENILDGYIAIVGVDEAGSLLLRLSDAGEKRVEGLMNGSIQST